MSENTTMGPRFSNRNTVLNPKSNLEVRSESQFRAQRRLDEPQRGPIAPLSAITGPPCHNGLFGMLQQVKGAVCLADPWSMAHGLRVMTLRSNSPMIPLATIVLRSCSPKAQVQSCPISLDISPSPTLRINLALPGTKISAKYKKATQLGGFKFRWCRRRDLNPHARYVGTSTSS